MNRRTFLSSSAALAALAPAGIRAAEKKKKSAAPAATAAARPSRPAPRAHKKGLMLNTFGGPTASKLSLREKFQMLRDAGFHGVEVNSAMNQTEVLAARDAAGLQIPSVVCATHWAKPLTHPSANEREVGLEGLRQALRDAKEYGAKSVLLVPGVVNKDVSYADAYTRSAAEIRKAIPLAESLGVIIAIENVWNGFLLSPLEAASYVDQFKSPLVRWHFDVGNIVNFGWPHHWIHALGSRIVAVHVKEFSRKLRDEKGPRAGFDAELLTGDSDWPEVMAALDKTNYTGWLITEQRRPQGMNDAEYLSHLSEKLDQILVA
jgi:L-ribulose-5-phosphate 3-epimerase